MYLYGVVSAALAVLAWFFFFRQHEYPEKYPLWKCQKCGVMGSFETRNRGKCSGGYTSLSKEDEEPPGKEAGLATGKFCCRCTYPDIMQAGLHMLCSDICDQCKRRQQFGEQAANKSD
ncbi:hypothetical protein CYMTET_32808 [Cymbomonas tetramitiformis]|uniref:Uncharacterized protein n=1 Tax=Cymbomonas tetramitiformis TaxID=36881 RepID=A0AAE0FEK8_9CHLO|nr:hypothetical protein CYMTET_32808 [Cymbomonas tetramitiformis]